MSDSSAKPHSPNKLGKKLFVIITTPVEGPPPGDRDAARSEHLEYQYELERNGTMFAAGPFLSQDDKPTGTGLIIYRAPSLEAAKQIADNDPFHKKGFRTSTINPWRVSEGTFSVRINYSTGAYEFD